MTTTEATTEGLRYIDSDGHILEHPTGMPDYAPAEFRDRIWHIETDESGQEWLNYNGNHTPANYLASAGTAGLSDDERARAFRGELRYTEVRPAAYNAKARLQDMPSAFIASRYSAYRSHVHGMPSSNVSRGMSSM